MTILSITMNSVAEITVVIPVKNNQAGIDLFLEKFFELHSGANLPAEIIIVDNNSAPAIYVRADSFPTPVRVVSCSKIGPASARNLGAICAKTNWILFTDSDCIPTREFLTGYLRSQNGAIGYSGNVKAFGNDALSRYYEQQEILVPPKVYDASGLPRPDYLITANCLVSRPAFDLIGGFNEQIQIAGGEDIDLGFRLRNIGDLAYAFESVALHNFGDGLFNFRDRFIRYGKGNKIIGNLYALDLRPRSFKPNKPSAVNYMLAFLQFFWLRMGYRKISKHRHLPELQNQDYTCNN